MSKLTRWRRSPFAYPFGIFLGLALLAYCLRGWAILTFMPGGIFLILFGLAIATGILYGVDRRRRF